MRHPAPTLMHLARNISSHASMAAALSLAIALSLSGCGAAMASADDGDDDGSAGRATVSNGDLVLGHWKGEGWWYPARVQGEPAAESVPLRYLDGDVETAPVARVRHFTWKAGTRVSCNFQGQGKYYPGTIKNMAGEGVSIHYDDGDREDTTIGRCRSQR